MHTPLLLVLAVLWLSCLAGALGTAHAAYPERAINVMIAFDTGGSLDAPTRTLAVELEKILAKPVIV